MGEIRRCVLLLMYASFVVGKRSIKINTRIRTHVQLIEVIKLKAHFPMLYSYSLCLSLTLAIMCHMLPQKEIEKKSEKETKSSVNK